MYYSANRPALHRYAHTGPWFNGNVPTRGLHPVTTIHWVNLPAKTTLQGTVKGGRRRDRQRKRWEDDIRERTGLEFGKSQRAVENREKWRKLVVKSSVVPQRPSRLRD